VIPVGNTVQELMDYFINSSSEGGCPLRSQLEPAFRLNDDEAFLIGDRTDVIDGESSLAADSDEAGAVRKSWHRLIGNHQAGKPGRYSGLISDASSRTRAARRGTSTRGCASCVRGREVARRFALLCVCHKPRNSNFER
jgi:hypothetical protein